MDPEAVVWSAVTAGGHRFSSQKHEPRLSGVKAVTAGGCVKTQIREIQVGETLRYTTFFTLAVVNAINLRRLIRLAVDART
ncbi:MAG TPA: hypothetical protein VE974_03930, partial [Thermoanaerobaculia bacterium]|nr:hypothetical protein [Thermoanaerobaculia bacterium]